MNFKLILFLYAWLTLLNNRSYVVKCLLFIIVIEVGWRLIEVMESICHSKYNYNDITIYKAKAAGKVKKNLLNDFRRQQK